MLANGQRIEGDRLSNWYDGGGVPHLGNHSLLAPAAPFRWLRDRTRRLAELPESYVEFIGGDRLPGVVTGYSDGQEDPYQPLPPHLIVRVALTFEPPENKPVPEIRVLTQYIKRIVWQKRNATAPQQNAAVYRDGRTLAFRAIRFRTGEINVLLNTGGERIAWDELAELNLSAAGSWDAWFDQVVAVCPSPETRLLEMETSTGLMATASLARLAARFEGNSADPDRWVHGLQPAWSLDILWVPFREIACYRSYAASEAPLGRISPREAKHRGGIGGASQARLNRNVHGGPLASKSLDFGWGLGVSGGTELTFDLPPAARTLRAAVCLDRSAGDGGCVRPRIFANRATGKPLWEGPILVGSDRVVETGVLELKTAGNVPATVVLQADPTLANRPAGADPLDIRDHLNWCDLLVGFDPAAIQAEFDRRLGQRFFAWSDWEVFFPSDTPAGYLQTTFERTNAIPGSFWPAVSASHSPLVIRRQWNSADKDAWLVISLTRAKLGLPDPRIEVRVAGHVAGEVAIMEPRRGEEGKLLVVHLPATSGAVGRAIPIEIRQQAQEKAIGVVWQSITFADQPPARFRLFEDAAELQPLAGDEGEPGAATLISDQRASGTHSLQVTPQRRFRIELPATVRVREQPKLGEARFIRFAVLTRGKSRAAIEFEDAQPREKPARYDIGTGPPAYGSAVRVADETQDQWVIITRDLFADFGPMDVEGLIVGCDGGESALLDHIYLARTRADFEPIDVGKTGKSQ